MAPHNFADLEKEVAHEISIATAPSGFVEYGLDPVDCGLCGSEMIPNKSGDAFTAHGDWLCDSCVARLRPDVLSLLDRLRRLDGTHAVRQVDYRDAGTTGPEYFRCPTCTRLDEPDGWRIVERASDRPICKHCALDRVPASTRDLWKALRHMGRVKRH
jgi:hypothetical protein